MSLTLNTGIINYRPEIRINSFIHFIRSLAAALKCIRSLERNTHTHAAQPKRWYTQYTLPRPTRSHTHIATNNRLITLSLTYGARWARLLSNLSLVCPWPGDFSSETWGAIVNSHWRLQGGRRPCQGFREDVVMPAGRSHGGRRGSSERGAESACIRPRRRCGAAYWRKCIGQQNWWRRIWKKRGRYLTLKYISVINI